MKNINYLKNKNREDISVRTTVENIIVPNGIHKYGGNTKTELDDINSFLDNKMDNINNKVIYFPTTETIEFNQGTVYPTGTIVRYNGQIFMAYKTGGDEISTSIPHELSDEWIALSDSNGNKCVAIDDGNSDITESISKYGHSIRNIFDILVQGKYHNYFKDGDYIKLSNNDINFTMRMNYREWQQTDGSLYRGVDLISDELIPDITLNISNRTGHCETNSMANEDVINQTPFYELMDIARLIEKFNESRFSQNIVNSFSAAGNKKKAFYYGYRRRLSTSFKDILKRDVYQVDRDSQGRSSDVSYTSGHNLYDGPHVWLPTEKEVFGQNLSANLSIQSNLIESTFKQYETLNTAYKRVKTLNGVPKPWATFSIHPGTLHPVIVSANGTQVPLYLMESNNMPFTQPVYVPLCLTLIFIKV